MRLRSFLRHVCGITARSLTMLKYHANGITRGGELLKSHDILHDGDIVRLTLPPEHNEITPVSGSIDTLYEDDYLLIVNKPPFMPVHPTKVHQTDTLANLISYYQHERGEDYTFRALNRLDKDTSGCVVIAKDRLTYALVQDSIRKTYLAICEGVIPREGMIDRPIALAPDSKIRRAISEGGQRAVTHYRVLETTPLYTLLELWLETGRTHQIRCHMSAVGHPLAGDDLYGGSREQINRQALHCRTVALTHPFTHERLLLNAPIPDDMLALISGSVDTDTLFTVDPFDPAEDTED